MAQYGSDPGFISQTTAQSYDFQANPVISADTTFGASPAGQSLLTQQLFGLPNATFDLTPPDPTSNIGFDNELPYWRIENYSDGEMSAKSVYDATTGNWGVKITPGTAGAGAYLALTTRSYLVNDDSLSLRQKAFSALTKGGTAAGTSQVSMTLTATYYSALDVALSTATIGTAVDTAAFTGISGYTTTGGSAISASAHYVDLQFKVLASANITGSVTFTIGSLLLSSRVGALSSFLITETFTSSTTWTVPTGITTLIAVAGIGAGGGGGGGGIALKRTNSNNNQAELGGASGGASGGWAILRDVNLGTATSVSVGIGSGGAGGTAGSASKAAAVNTESTSVGGNGSAGGATTFGSFVTFPGGGGGLAGAIGTAAAEVLGGTAIQTPVGGTTSIYGISAYPATQGTASASGKGSDSRAGGNPNGGNGTGGLALTVVYTPALSGGTAGGSATYSGTAITTNATGTLAGGAASSTPFNIGGGGGGGAGHRISQVEPGTAGNAGANSTSGGAGGAVSVVATASGSGTVTATGGLGGGGGLYGGGGGAGGLATITGNGTATGTAIFTARPMVAQGGVGGSGAGGAITIVYVG
jgi:hypothetical protein